MRRFRGNVRGLSELVGSLMLVLIVVAAATTLSIFVAEYQKQAQAEQSLDQQRNLESIKIIQVALTLNGAGTDYALLNFTVASLYINPSTITEISVNNNPLEQYTAYRLNLTTGTDYWATVAAGGTLTLNPREVLNVLVNLSAGANYSFYAPSYTIPVADYIEVQVFTAYANDFNRVFIPPTAIAFVSTQETWDGSAYVPVILLDGSQSFQPAPGNATLVAWSWTITPGPVTLLGERAIAPFPANTTTPFSIALTVTNSDGLVATDTITYP
jgi:flagellin-like protein